MGPWEQPHSIWWRVSHHYQSELDIKFDGEYSEHTISIKLTLTILSYSFYILSVSEYYLIANQINIIIAIDAINTAKMETDVR